MNIGKYTQLYSEDLTLKNYSKNTKDMIQVFKQNFLKGEEVVFDNERTNMDDFRSMECSYRNETHCAWANGYKITFNGANYSYKTFNAFYKKAMQLISDWKLELTQESAILKNELSKHVNNSKN